jgi:acetylornithine deacetylase/succinyl-diaminopimelate desuccinylase-like protein
MSREATISAATRYFDSGLFKADLSRRVAIRSESQTPNLIGELYRYIDFELRPVLVAMGFDCRTMTDPSAPGPFLYAERTENAQLPTVLGYGHGDVIRGLDSDWNTGLSPWTLNESDGCYWGRGTADNKGQHSINIAAMAAVLHERGHLGFNAKWLFETGEEIGSPGLRELCTHNRDLFRADLLLASDGPRLNADEATIFLGNRGSYLIDLWINAREGGHHSGNWGGLISNPAIQLVHAISTIIGPMGQIRVSAFVPESIPDDVRRALAKCHLNPGPDAPAIDPTWSEPGLSPEEKVFAWSSFEILTMVAGNPDAPVNAIPGMARARAQVRFVAGVDSKQFIGALRRHLDRQGFPMVQVVQARNEVFEATRLGLDHPWVQWTVTSILRTMGYEPNVLPNIGGSLPNDIFSDVLGIPTIWVPHSYLGCRQHAVNEHLPLAIAREGLRIMSGLYWDLGTNTDAVPRRLSK